MGVFNFIKRILWTGPAELEARALQQYSFYETFTPTWGLTDTSKYVAEGHRKNALAYRCVEYVANAVGMATLEAIRVTPSGERELPDRDPLAVLIEKPSSTYPSQAQFMRQVVRLLMVTGECILYKVPGEVTGRIVELQILPSKKIAVKKDTQGNRQYEYHVEPGQPPKILKTDEVIFIKFDDVDNPDRGLAPLQAAARETDVDNAAADIRKAFFENGTMLEGILTTDQPANDKELKAWSALWRERYGGKDKAAKRTPALAGGLKYQETSSTPDKWAFPDVTGLSEARICSAFGAPPILVGAKIGLDRSTYANYKEARSAFWEDAAAPLLKFLAETFTAGLTAVGDRRRLRWNTDEVPALQEDVDKREERAGRSLVKGTITINEYREAIGLDTIPDGDLYMVPSTFTLVPAGELDVDRTPEALKPENLDPEGDSNDQQDTSGDQTGTSEGQQADGAAEEPSTNGSRSEGGPYLHSSDARMAREEPEGATIGVVTQGERDVLERRLARAIEDVLGKQAATVRGKVKGGDLTHLRPAHVFDLGIEAERMAEAITPHFRAILEDRGDDLEGEEAVEFLGSAPLRYGMGIAEETRDLIVLGKGSPNWLEASIKDRSRADAIASQICQELANT